MQGEGQAGRRGPRQSCRTKAWGSDQLHFYKTHFFHFCSCLLGYVQVLKVKLRHGLTKRHQSSEKDSEKGAGSRDNRALSDTSSTVFFPQVSP